jgi:hypothetical protein
MASSIESFAVQPISKINEQNRITGTEATIGGLAPLDDLVIDTDEKASSRGTADFMKMIGQGLLKGATQHSNLSIEQTASLKALEAIINNFAKTAATAKATDPESGAAKADSGLSSIISNLFG